MTLQCHMEYVVWVEAWVWQELCFPFLRKGSQSWDLFWVSEHSWSLAKPERFHQDLSLWLKPSVSEAFTNIGDIWGVLWVSLGIASGHHMETAGYFSIRNSAGSLFLVHKINRQIHWNPALHLAVSLRNPHALSSSSQLYIEWEKHFAFSCFLKGSLCGEWLHGDISYLWLWELPQFLRNILAAVSLPWEENATESYRNCRIYYSEAASLEET